MLPAARQGSIPLLGQKPPLGMNALFLYFHAILLRKMLDKYLRGVYTLTHK